MINPEHYINSYYILNNYPWTDDGDTFKISYDFQGKHFTIKMKYFVIDEIFFGFIHFVEQNNILDEDSSYLVGYLIQKYIWSKYDNIFIDCCFTFYTDKDIKNEFYKDPKYGLDHIHYFDVKFPLESTKYKFHMSSSCNGQLVSKITNQQIIDFMDTEL